MSTIHVCDRCKAATTKPTTLVLTSRLGVMDESEVEHVDLCEGCLADLRQWLRGKTPPPARDPDLGWSANGVWHTPRSPGWRE